MDNSLQNSEQHSRIEVDSNVSYNLSNSDNKEAKKGKKRMKVEKIGENNEYDQSLLKRRKKKLQGKGITLAVPKKSLTAYAIFVKQKRREMQD